MENKEFDKKISQQLSQRKIEVSADAWEKIESQLDEKKPMSYSKMWWVAAAFLLLGLTFVFNWEKTDSSISDIENAQPSFSIDSTKTPNTPEVLQTDSPKDVLTIVDTPENKKVGSVRKNEIKPLLKSQSDKSNENTVAFTQPIPIIEIPEKTTVALKDEGIINQENDVKTTYAQLVMNQLNRSNSSITVDANELMQLTENELHTNKNIRQILIEKFKNTVQDLPIAQK